jgi:hypothetical protein
MDLDEAARLTGFSTEWLAEATTRGVIRAAPEAAGIDLPRSEVMFLRRARPWLLHLLDAIAVEHISSAVLFGRDATPTDARARDSILLTTVDDPGRALDLTGTLSVAARRDIYVVTWSSGTQNPALVRPAITRGRVLRDEGRSWRHLVERELSQEARWLQRDIAARERVTTLLRQWAATDPHD